MLLPPVDAVAPARFVVAPGRLNDGNGLVERLVAGLKADSRPETGFRVGDSRGRAAAEKEAGAGAGAGASWSSVLMRRRLRGRMELELPGPWDSAATCDEDRAKALLSVMLTANLAAAARGPEDGLACASVLALVTFGQDVIGLTSHLRAAGRL
jgi:hypothetical protein